MIVSNVRWSFRHVQLPELFTRWLGDFKSGNGANLVGVHGSNDFGSQQDQQFVLFLSTFLGGKEQSADHGNVAQDGNSTDFGVRSMRQQSRQGQRLTLTQFHFGLNAPCIRSRNPPRSVAGVQIAVFRDDRDSNQIAVDDGGSGHQRSPEATERRRSPLRSTDADNGRNRIFTT